MSLSIILPTYNRAHLLRKWLNNIYQSPPAEVIIVDDCSTDNTPKVAASFPAKYIRNETNKGVTYSNFIGLTHVTSKFVLFSADDDSIRPDALEKLRNNLDNSFGFVAGRSEWHNRKKDIHWICGRSLPAGRYSPSRTLHEATQGYLRVPYEATAYNVNLIRQHNLYRPELLLNADVYMLYWLAFQYPFLILDEVLTDFYLNPNGYYANNKDAAGISELLELFEKTLPYSVLQDLQQSGIVGFIAGAAAIKKQHPAWDTVPFRGHLLLRKFERLTHKYIPGIILKHLTKYYV